MSSSFYIQTSFCVASFWILLSSATEKALYQVTEGSVVTIPSWMPKQVVLFLHRYRPQLFNGETIGLALACSFPEVLEIRVLAALLFTLYHLVESSKTNRHGEYPILYTMWALCLQENEYRHACAWGIAINFVLSTGYAKIAVGGLSKSGIPLWTEPSTMETYLLSYRCSGQKLNRPLVKKWSLILGKSKRLCKALATSVLFLECVAIPATLFVGDKYRPLACYAMITMHIGIACCMSFKVGLVFLTSIPTYMYGFACSAEFGSKAWQVAAAIGLGPTLASILLISLPENWPLTPVSLFMWNGKAAKRLLHLLMIGDTRIILTTSKVAAGGIIGLRVLHLGEYLNENEKDSVVVHDCVMRVLGFTMVQSNAIVKAVRALEHNSAVVCSATKTLLNRIAAWVSIERRLVEAHTGETLTQVYLVRIDGARRVSEVLL